MPGFWRPSRDDGEDELAVLVVEHQLRSQQVDPAHVAAAKVGAVAEPAVDSERRLPRAMSAGSPGGRCCGGNVA